MPASAPAGRRTPRWGASFTPSLLRPLSQGTRLSLPRPLEIGSPTAGNCKWTCLLFHDAHFKFHLTLQRHPCFCGTMGRAKKNVLGLWRCQREVPAAVLPRLPRGADEAESTEAQRPGRRVEKARELPCLRERLSPTRSAEIEAVRGLRGKEGADAPPRLRQAAGGGLAVQGAPLG